MPAVSNFLVSMLVFGGLLLPMTHAQTNLLLLTNIQGNFQTLAVSGHYLYAGRNELQGTSVSIFDLSNPARPVDVGYRDEGGSAFSLALSSNRLFVVRWYNPTGAKVDILDISNPVNPVSLAGIAGFWGNITVAGKYAYISRGYGWGDQKLGLAIFDISDSTHPVQVGQRLDQYWGPVSLLVKETNAYIINGNGWLEIWDISDPASLKMLSSEWYYTATVCADESRPCVFVGPATNGVWAVDVSNPTNQVMLSGGINSGTWNAAMTISGNYLYATGEHYIVPAPLPPAEIEIWDISNPTNIFLTSRVIGGGDSIVVSSDYLYAAGRQGLQIYSLQTTRPSLGISCAIENTLELSWPVPTSGFLVQCNTNLPTNTWLTLTNRSTIVGSRNQVTITRPTTPTFYRLISE